MKLTSAVGVEHKLVKKQLQAIDLNKALLAMYTNQVGSRAAAATAVAPSMLTPALCRPLQADQCRKLASSLQSQDPSHPRPVLIQAAQLCREKQHAKAIELLQVENVMLDFGSKHFLN